MAQKRDFNPAIADLEMPDMDGMEMVEVIKRERPDMAVIIVTAYPTAPSAVKGMKLGAADFIPKPFTPDEMSTAVKRALQQKKHETKTEKTVLLINKEAIIVVLIRTTEDKDFAGRFAALVSGTSFR